MKILIVGGGIAGLTLAAYLREDFEVHVIEKAKRWRTIGYAITLMPNGLHALESIGVADMLRKNCATIPCYEARNEQGKPVWHKNLEEFSEKYGPVSECERDLLHRTLRKANKDTGIRLDTTITDLEQTPDNVHVLFSDGTEDSYDIVVGADGINSQIRGHVQESPKKDYAGMTFWIMWVPNALEHEKIMNIYGNEQYIAVGPCKNKTHTGVMFMVPAKAHSVTNAEQARPFIREHFSGMRGIVPQLLENLPETPQEMYHHDDDEVHTREWYSGRIVLIGDAVHALSPILGMGASMAMEDAFVLQQELRKKQPIASAFSKYRKRRQPRVDHLAKWSKRFHFYLRVRVPGFLAPVRDMLARRTFERYFQDLDRLLSQDV